MTRFTRAVTVGALTVLAARELAAQRPRSVEEAGPARRTAPAPPPRPRTTAVAATGAARGRYRVTLTGFQVFQETVDNALQLDGKCDEVFISADVRILDASGGQVLAGLSPRVTSYVFGDVNGQASGLRRQAGHCSARGGLRRGDQYPEGDAFSAQPLPGPMLLPLQLWEGELVEGENAVVVTPTIWEYDGSQNASVFAGWVKWADRTAEKLQGSKELEGLVGDVGAQGIAVVRLGLELAQSVPDQLLGRDEDRPIGVHRTGGSFTFEPQSLALNYRSVETFLGQRHQVGSLPPGVFPLAYVDSGDWGGGNYTLFVKIERVP